MVKRKEPGSGATSYAFYFIVIIIAIAIFMYLRFNALLYVLEHEVETNLHILESATITVNQDDVESGDREDKYGKEIDRKHIITAEMKNGTGMNTDEEKQLKAVGDYFSKAFVEKFKLEGNLHPSEGILKEICGPSASIRIGTVRIVEPFYQYNSQNEVEIGDEDDKISLPELDGTDHDFLGDEQNKFQINSSNIEIVGWKEYELHFDDNNNFTSVTVTGTYAADEAPKFLGAKNKKKKEVNGATIEATALIDFNGIKNVFANMAMEEPEISGAVEFNEEGKITRNDFNIDYKGTDKKHLFADNPSYLHYDVGVTEAYDIVIAKDLKKAEPKDDGEPTPDLLPGTLSWTSRVWAGDESRPVVHPIFRETYFKNTFAFEYEKPLDDIISKFNGQTIEFYPLDYHNYLNWADENVDAAREKLSDIDYSNYTGYEIDLRDDSGAIIARNEEASGEFHYTSDTLDTEFLYGVIRFYAVKDTYDLNGDLQLLRKLHYDDHDYNLKYWDAISITYIVPAEDMSKIAELINFYNEWKSKEPSDDIEDYDTREELWNEYNNFYDQKINEIMDDHGIITLSNGYTLKPIKIEPEHIG